MRLLWHVEVGSRPGPKPSLSVDQIVAKAIELANLFGLEALSMRKLAKSLEVKTMTLYTYVKAKSDLLDLMYDRVVGESYRELLDDLVETGRTGWRDRLEAIARSRWELHRRHLWFGQVAWTRTPLGPNVLDAYEKALSVVADLGLSGKEMTEILTLVSAYVDGAARMAVEAVVLPSLTSIDDDAWWRAVSPILEEVWDESRYPILSSSEMSDAWDQTDKDSPYFLAEAVSSFEFGLARVLDGIEVFVDSRTK
jgi:AcrR family transcriptional regulator